MEREKKEKRARDKEEERLRKERAKKKREDEEERRLEAAVQREMDEKVAAGVRESLLEEENRIFGKRGSVGHSPDKERLERELEEKLRRTDEARREVRELEMKLQDEEDRLNEEEKRKRGGVLSEGTAGINDSDSEEEGDWRQGEKGRRPEIQEGRLEGLQGVAILEEFLEERGVSRKMSVVLKSKLTRAVRMITEELGKKMGGDMYYKGKYEAMAEVVDKLGSEVRGMREEMKRIKEQGEGVAALRREVVELKRDMGKLGRGKFETREEVLMRGGSYADKVRVGRLGLEVPVIKKKEMLLIEQEEQDEGKKITGEEVKAKVMEAIDPVADGIRINWVRKTRRGGVIMELGNKESADVIRGKEAMRLGKLKVEAPKGRRPKIIVYDLPRDQEEKEVKRKLFAQNGLDELGASVEDLVVLFKTGDRSSPRVNWVCEASPGVRKALLDKGRAYVDYYSVNVADFLRVTRCYRCQEYGHIGKVCRAPKSVCGQCGREGHEFKECPDKGRPSVCPNCRKAGKEADHKVQSEECAIYRLRLQQEVDRTNYMNGH